MAVHNIWLHLLPCPAAPAARRHINPHGTYLVQDHLLHSHDFCCPWDELIQDLVPATHNRTLQQPGVRGSVSLCQATGHRGWGVSRAGYVVLPQPWNTGIGPVLLHTAMGQPPLHRIDAVMPTAFLLS